MANPTLDEFLSAARVDNPGVSDGQLAGYWLKTYANSKTELPKPEATAGGLIRSFGSSAIDTVGSAFQGGGEVVAAGLRAATGNQDIRAANPLRPVTDAIRGGMSENDKLASQDTFKGDITDPASIELPKTAGGWAHAIASGFGSLSSMILPGAMAATGARGMIMAGAATGALTTGGAAADDVRQGVQKAMEGQTPEQLAQSVPAYRQARLEGMDDGTARQKVENDAAILATTIAGAAGAVGGAFNAKVLEDVVAKRGLATLLGKVSASRAGQIGIGAGVGVAAEGLQEGLEKVGQNVGENIGLGRPAMENATRDTAGDVIMGGLIGGVTGGAAGAVTQRPAEKAQADDIAARQKAVADIATAPDVDSAIAAFNVATAPSPDLAAARTDPIEFDRLGALGMINAAPAPSAPADTGEAIPYDYSQRQQMYPALPAPETASGRDVLVNDTDPQLTRPEQMGDREAAINYQQAQREQAESDRDLGITPGTRKAIRARITLDEAGNIIDAPDGDRQFLSLVRREARPHAAAAIEAHSINPTLTEAVLAAPNMGPKAERTVFEAIINGNPADQQTRTLLERYGVPGRLADSNGQGAQPVNPAPPGQQSAGDQRQLPGGPGQAGTSPDAGIDNRNQGVGPAAQVLSEGSPGGVGPTKPLTVKTDAELRLQAKNTRAPDELKAISDELARRKREAAPAQSTAVAPKGKHPNMVIRQVRDRNGNMLGTVMESYDGTIEGARKAAEAATKRMYDEFPDAGNVASRMGATDESGNPKYAISPNFAYINPVDSVDGRATFGDADAIQQVYGPKVAKDVTPTDAPKSLFKPSFDPEVFDRERNERIEASRKAGNVHLDKVPAYVESMRGKRVRYVHDPKVTGTIRTVDNRGNVYIDWADEYSAQKEMASPVKEGKRTVMRSTLGPSDLKDYVIVQEAETPKAKTRAKLDAQKPATAQAAIDAFNADDAKTGMEIVAKLKLDALKEVGAAIGFSVNFTENATRYRERLAAVADRLTKSAREQTGRERKLFDRLSSLANDWDRMADHTGAPEGSYDGKWMTHPEARKYLVAELDKLKNDPDYEKVAPMVRKARPRLFDAAETRPPKTEEQPAENREALQSAMEAEGWAAEDAGPANTYWSKRVGKERYTAILRDATMEITVLAEGGVDTQIDSFDVADAGAAAKAASKAVADEETRTAAEPPQETDQQYSRRIMREMAEAKKAREAEEAAAAEEAKYQPFNAADIKKPTPSSIGLTPSTASWARGMYEGRPVWTNRKIVDFAGGPKGVEKGMMPGGETQELPVDKIVPKEAATVPGVPVTVYHVDGKEVQYAVGLKFGDKVAAIGRDYFAYFTTTYPGATFMVEPGFIEAGKGAGVVRVMRDGQMIGLISQVRMDDAFRAKVRDMASEQPPPTPVAEPVAPAQEKGAAKPKAESVSRETESSVNKRHTIAKASALTPAGALRAAATDSKAPSSVWYYQGDIGMLGMQANVTIEGQPDSRAEQAKALLERIKALKKDGWLRKNVRAGSLGTVWVFEKGDQFLTRAGMENATADAVQRPDMPEAQAGYESLMRRKLIFAKGFSDWLNTLDGDQQQNRGVVSRKIGETPVKAWARIVDDNGGVTVEYLKPDGGVGHRISVLGDWDDLRRFVHALAKRVDQAKNEGESWTLGLEESARDEANVRLSTYGPQPKPAAPEAPATKPEPPKSLVDQHVATMTAVRKGEASLEAYKAGFQQVIENEAAIKAELSKESKDFLMARLGGHASYHLKRETKAGVVDAFYRAMVREYALDKSYGPNSYFMTRGGLENHEREKLKALTELVENQTGDDLEAYAAERRKAQEESEGRRAEFRKAIEDPKTLQQFRDFVSYHKQEGKTFAEARMMLTPEQRRDFDNLTAAESRAGRKERRDDTAVNTAGQTVDGEVIATKHTRSGEDLYVVKLAERVSREDYTTLLTGAKRLGGWYSSFRGNGAVPGFQFKDRANAEAFRQLAGGDKTAAQEAAAARRDSFEDDRSQSAVERLTEMADRLADRATEELTRDRKTNTERRARQAASSEARAESDKALAKTMRNIANAIKAGKATFLDRVRQKVQVEYLFGVIRSAKDAELRTKYPSYADQERHKGEAPTIETADFADFPSFTAYRSDLARLGRQLLEVDGLKLMGQRIMKVADDVSDAYTDFAKANLYKVSTFRTADGNGAKFASRDQAEASIRRSKLTGIAIVLPVKRGENVIVLSPSEAIKRGIWQGDGDKRITLDPDFGAELVQKASRRRGAKDAVPWQFETANQRRQMLARMGIETPAEFRAMLREFVDLREQPNAPDKVKEMERSMIGRRNDGLDFFPTPETTADQMVEAAGIEPGMSVLEPSGGMGHIAERIRAAGVEPDVVEMSVDRRALLELKGFRLVGSDFMDMNPRTFFTYGDTFKAPDGKEGVLRGLGGMGSDRVRLVDDAGEALGYYDRDDLTPVRKNGVNSGYDRIIMNPPFSDGRDIEHVRHAYELLKPGGRLVAIMGEGAFTNQNKRAAGFRDWLEEVGGTEEKLDEGTFLDPSLPVNTGVNARMVVIEKGDSEAAPMASRPGYTAPYRDLDAARFTVKTSKTGMPVYLSRTMALSNAREKDALGVPKGGRALAFDIFDRRMKDANGMARKVGMVLVHQDAAGKFVSLRNIQIDPAYREQGYYHGEGVIAGMLLHNGTTPMEVFNIQSAAKGDEDDALPFWKHIGTTILNNSSDPDVIIEGNISLARYMSAGEKRANYGQSSRDSREQPISRRDEARVGEPNARRDGGDQGRGSRTGRVDAVRAELTDAFGEAGVAALEREGILQITTWDAAPKGLTNQLQSGDHGAYWPSRKTAYIFADNLAPGQAVEVLLHEIGEHYGLEEMLGDRYDRTVAQVKTLHKAGNKAIVAAWKHVERNYDLTPGSPVFMQEVIAKAGQSADVRKMAWWQRLIADVKAFLIKVGLKNVTSERDLGILLRASVRKAMRDAGTVSNQASGVMAARAFHGTPHNVDRFSTDKIGTGEGAQAFGWGLYFAENQGVARDYALNLTDINGGPVRLDNSSMIPRARYGSVRDGIESRERFLAKLRAEDGESARKQIPRIEQELRDIEARANVYQVDIPDEVVARMLDWDRPLSEQPASVRDAIAPIVKEMKGWNDGGITYPSPQILTGEGFYGAMERHMGSARRASMALDAAGVPGIRYLDAGSRNRPLREIKKEFLAELPEDADFEEVRDLIGTGTFSPQNDAILQALEADDWLGFDYPAQALSAALSKDAGGFEISPELRQAISAAQDGGTRNLVVFNDKNITITHKDGTPVTAKERADLVMASRPDDAPMASRNQTSTPALDGDMRSAADSEAKVVSSGLSGDSARTVRIDRVVAAQTNATDKARKRGFYDVMLGLPSRAADYSKISVVSYEQGMTRAKNLRRELDGKPWIETENVKDGAKWKWRVYREGYLVANGEESSETKAHDAIIGARVTLNERDDAPLASRGTIGATWDMLQSAKTPAQARALAMNLFDNPNKFNLWDKTIGTQLTKARKNEYFRAVFDNLQGQQDSTAAYAIEAEAEAADVLARMEGLGEIKSALKSTFTGLKFEKGSILPQGERARDLQAVSKAIFSNIEGEQGVKQKVFTDAELAKDFGLNERQIGLYRQSRAAIDRSLDRYAQSLAVRMAQKFVSTGDLHRAGLDDTVTALTERLRLQRQTLEEQREPEQSVEDMEARLAELEELRDSAPREILRSLQTGPDGETRQEFVGMPDTAAATALDREIRDLKKAIRSGDGFNPANRELDAKIQALDAVLSKLPEIQEQANSLKDKGYAPAMRFGDYAVTATQDGETVFFTMVDTKTQANLLKMRLAREMPGAELRVNAVDRESFKLFGGVDPATVELFARFMEVEENDAFKAYIALATSSRSALKHMLERKGIAGFSDNLPRVMAAFITSNARAAARNIHGFDVNEAMEAAQKNARGDVSEEAAKLVNYMNNPTGDFAKVRGFMFAYFMGGSVSSALVNLTQPLMMTTPYLEQFAGKKIGGIMVRASKAAATGKVEGPMKAALERAEAEGITDAHEYHQLMQEAEGGGSVATRALMKSWGSMFGAAERFNRRITFLAAFETGQGMTKEELSKRGVGDAYEFAKDAVVETQGIYARHNRPNWARNPVGAVALTFKQFSIAWVEFFMRLPRKQQLMALGLLILMAGIEGLPFAEDIEDLIDTIGQRMGRGTNSKKALRTAATNLLGETGAQFALHGISGLAGMPMDVAGRLGMGNLIPGTKLLNPSVKEKGREVAEIAGPVSGLVQKAGGLADGNIKEAMPKAFADAAKAWEMIQTGEYRDTRGRKVMDVDGMDSLMKMIGFQPRDVAANTRFIGENMRDVDIVKRVEAEIVEQWADGIRNKDVAESQEARERLKRWNAENPDLPIKVKFSQILQRVRAANLSRDERFMKTAPPELRRRMLAEAVQ